MLQNALLPSPPLSERSCCVCVRRISLGGEGNALYPELSGFTCNHRLSSIGVRRAKFFVRFAMFFFYFTCNQWPALEIRSRSFTGCYSRILHLKPHVYNTVFCCYEYSYNFHSSIPSECLQGYTLARKQQCFAEMQLPLLLRAVFSSIKNRRYGLSGWQLLCSHLRPKRVRTDRSICV